MDYKENFGIMMPQSFMTSYSLCIVHVPFEFKDKWGEFKKWIEEGNLVQLNWGTSPVDVWIFRTDLMPDSPADLQTHFNNYCQPKGGYGYTQYEIKKH